MRRLEELIARLKALEQRIIDAIVEAVKENDSIIIELNIDEQLYTRGVNRNDVPISDYAPYAMLTLEIKTQKGQPTDRVTLQDEGDFHNSFFIDYKGDGFEISATDWKTEALVDKYGKEILGLTDDNLRAFAEDYIKPAIQEALETL